MILFLQPLIGLTSLFPRGWVDCHSKSYHVAISLDIALTAIFVSNDLFFAAMLQDKLHPALAALIPLSIMADKRQGHNQFNIFVSRLFLQTKDLFSRPHINTQGAANIKALDFPFIM